MSTPSLLRAALAAALLSLTPLASAQIGLDLQWTRLGDSEGVLGQERGVASIESAEFSPDGTLIVSGAKRGGDVVLWTSSGQELWRRYHAGRAEVEVVAFTKDGSYAVSGGEDGFVRVWRVSDGAQVQAFSLGGSGDDVSFDGMRFSHSGNRLAGGDEFGQLSVWDTSAPNPANWPTTPLVVVVQGSDQDRPGGGSGQADINSVDWSSDDQFIVTAGRDGTIKRWRVSQLSSPQGGLVQTYTGFQSSIKSVRLSPDDALVAAGGQLSPDGLVLVWDVATGAVVRRIDYSTFGKIEAVEWTRDGRYLFTGGIEGVNYSQNCEGICNAPRSYPSTNGFGNIRAYDRQNGFALALTQPTFRQEYFHFSPDGGRLASSHEDGGLRLWTVTRGGGGPIAGVPVGQTIWLRATVNGRFVAADLTRGAVLIADRTAVRSWERFAVTDGADQDPATVAFRAEANGRFVAADPGGVVEARGLTAGPSDRFAWEPQSDGTVCLRSRNTGGYVVAEDAGASPLRADRGACLGWERFAWGVAGQGATAEGAPSAAAQAAARAVPAELALEPPSPNPARSGAAVAFGLPEPADVRVEVYDALGRRVAVVAEGPFEAGWHRATLDAAALPAGLYLVRLQAGGAVRTRPVTLAR